MFEALKPSVAEAFRSCVGKETTTDSLRNELQQFQRDAEQAVGSDQVLDHALAEDLIEHCLKLLDRAASEPDSEVGRLARAAVLYVVTVDDANSDAMSLLGLEDDLEVVRAVERVIT